eukprot:CAMPEP_0197929930 /NCGR_PEP_ID=MMETSP1439-20131203/104629_1 /TAXON_ID=66791 /ORGANISM="Gonyaulax spinifera, Strain CCMP409" /LENGTH=465 /DNA_ID=CAMNT_0043552597 /DNA_START=93 /DNA_END=1490 /DNA_ORIENTATION=-
MAAAGVCSTSQPMRRRPVAILALAFGVVAASLGGKAAAWVASPGRLEGRTPALRGSPVYPQTGVPTLAGAASAGATRGGVALPVALAALLVGLRAQQRQRLGRKPRAALHATEVGAAAGASEDVDRSQREALRAITAMAVCLAVAVGGASQASAADGGGDWFQPFVNLNAGIISGIDGVVGSAGLAIVLYTLLLKALTFPLNQVSMRTNVILQAIQPQTQEIQRRYESEEIDEATSGNLLNRVYGEYGIFPLFGLIVPLFVQLPVFVSLFRAIGQLASQDEHFRQGFLWIPSLAGPVELGRPGLDWLLKTQSADSFVPLVGWTNAGLYCLTPVILVILQFLSQRIVPSPGNTGWAGTVVTGFIGMSALVSPQAVGVYWLVNQSLTSAQMVLAREQVNEEFPALLKEAAKAEVENDGIRYTRRSGMRDESDATKKVDEYLKPKIAPARSRTGKRKQAMADKRKARR